MEKRNGMDITENVLECIEETIDVIYGTGSGKITDAYGRLLNALETFLIAMSEQGYQVDMTQELNRMNMAMQKKDNILLADILAYEIKPEFENLEL